MIDSRQRAINSPNRSPSFSQTLKCLRRCNLMYEVTVDVNERVSTCRRRGTGRRIGRRCENDVVVKDLVVERSGGRGRRHYRRKSCVAFCVVLCCVMLWCVWLIAWSYPGLNIKSQRKLITCLSCQIAKGKEDTGGRQGRLKGTSTII